MAALGPSVGSAQAVTTSTAAAATADRSVNYLYATANTTSVSLSWAWSGLGTKSFTVRRDGGDPGVTPTPTTGTLVYAGELEKAVDVGVEPWTRYRYTVWADDGAGGFLTPESFTTTTSVQAVTGLAAKARGAAASAITWAAPRDPGVTAVTVTRTGPQGAIRTVYSGTAPGTIDTTVVPGVDYDYTVVAQDASGRRGPVSPGISLTTHRTWTTAVASPYAGWPGAMACATPMWCLSANNTGTFQVMSGTTWSAPVQAFKADSNPQYSPVVSSLTCPAVGRCLAVRGNIIVEFVGGAWRSAAAPSAGWSSVDCPTATYCVAIRRDGWSTTRVGATWTAPVRIGSLRGVSWSDVACQAPARCFAIATGTSTYSNWRGTLTPSGWSTAYLGSHQLGNAYSISCSTSTCLALGDRTRVTVSGTTWSIRELPPHPDFTGFTRQVSCGSPTLCMAWNEGDVARWSSTAVVERTRLSAGIGDIAAVSCPRNGGVCFAVDNRGRFYRWTSTKHWVLVSTYAPTTGGVGRVGCRTTTSCFFVDHNGWLVAWNGSTWTRFGQVLHPAGPASSAPARPSASPSTAPTGSTACGPAGPGVRSGRCRSQPPTCRAAARSCASPSTGRAGPRASTAPAGGRR